MKLLIVLSLIAYGYADKLDRTYLPPPGAATAGGSPGSLTAPGQESFGQQAPGFRGSQPQAGRPFDTRPAKPNQGSGFGQPSGPSQPIGQSSFGQTRPNQASGFGQPSGPGQPSGQSSFGQARPNSASGYGQPSGPSTFGQARPNQASGFGQPSGSDNSGSASGFGRPSGQASFGQPSGTGVQPPSFGQPQFGQNSGQGAQGNFGPQQPERPQAAADRNAEILRYENQNDGETFSYNFETSNGISAEESGVATNGVQAQGGFSYTGDDGQFYKITYTADENGYLPQGDHLPTPPPIPDEILRSIEENARAAAAGTQEGAYNPDEDDSPQYSPPSFNQGQGQQFTGSNGFGPSTSSAGQSQSGSQGQGFNQGSGQGFDQGSGQGFNQGSGQGFNKGSGQGNQGFGQGSAQPGLNGNQQGFQRAQGQGQGQSGYDYSRPQNQGRQPSGSPNAIPSGPSKTGSQNQARPFPGQNQPSQSSLGNQRQYLAPEANQPQRQPGGQSFGSASSYNQGSSAGPRSQPSSQGSNQVNQIQGFGSGSQSNRGSASLGQNRPTNQQQPQLPGQRGQDSQGQRGPSGQGNGQDGYDYNRPQSAFNSGNQAQSRPQPQGPSGSRPQGSGFPGSGAQSQPGFPGSQPTGFPGSSSRPSQPQGISGSSSQFPGSRGQGPQFGQPQRPGSSNQRQETFGGPRQPPSFSPEEGYKY